MGLSAPEKTIRSLLQDCGATVLRSGQRTIQYAIPGCKDPFLLDTGRKGDYRAAQNQLSCLRRLIAGRTQLTEFGSKVAMAVGGGGGGAEAYSQPQEYSGTVTGEHNNQSQAPKSQPPPSAPPAAPESFWPADITQFCMKRMIVTPDLALEWLERNTDNRNIQTDHVNRLVRDMIAGEFVFNGESVRFDTTGRMIDGQHRMWAVVESKVSVDIIVVWGLKPEVFNTIDTGKSKSAVNFMQSEHVKNANVVAAVCRLVLFHEHGQISKQKHGNLAPTVTEVMEILRRHPELQESAAWASGPIRKVMRPAIAAYMHYMCSRKHPEQWQTFSHKWVTGANLDPSDPIFHLRKRVLENRNRITTIDPVYLLGLVIKCWNLSLRQKSIGSLNMKEGEAFPEIE